MVSWIAIRGVWVLFFGFDRLVSVVRVRCPKRRRHVHNMPIYLATLKRSKTVQAKHPSVRQHHAPLSGRQAKVEMKIAKSA